MSLRVFVAYSRRDERDAIAVTQALRHQGLEVWFDLDDAEPGPSLSRQISDAISAADAMVWVGRRDTPLSRWVALELSWAVDAGRPLHAISLDATTDLTTQVSTIHRALQAAAARGPADAAPS